ncbi:unnamed protein product [Peronospora belbahrii]|uniref:Pseudouridine synthase RsuA/RluA-like domain-containing protein n=1 Tax=Peronospora belbahrii TaxID=622444 RepID=A0AAU9L8V6_9STRA|nr:unnamed protein product [Peronospora belbahrii]
MHIIPLSCRNTAHSGIVSPLDSRASLSVDDDDDAMTYRYKSEFRWMRHVIRAQDHEIRLDVVQSSSWLIESLDRYLPSIAKSFTDKSDPLQQDNEEQQTLKVVHRLDMNTSGVLVLARSRLAAAKFFQLLRHGAVQKTYEALVSAAISPLSSDNNYSMLKKFEDERLNTM